MFIATAIMCRQSQPQAERKIPEENGVFVMFCVACPITFTVILGLIPAGSTKANFSAGRMD